MTMMSIRSAIAVAGLFLVLHVAGCNTVEGVGKDAEKAGEKIQDVADDAKN